MKAEQFDYDAYQKDTASIVPTRINDYLCNNHSLLAYYGYQEVLWRYQVDMQSQIVSCLASEIEEDLRAEYKDAKVTESAIKTKINLNKELEKENKTLIRFKHQERLYANAVRTIQDRSRQLTNLSNNLRAELGTSHSHLVEHDAPQTSGKLSDEERREILNTAMGR